MEPVQTTTFWCVCVCGTTVTPCGVTISQTYDVTYTDVTAPVVNPPGQNNQSDVCEPVVIRSATAANPTDTCGGVQEWDFQQRHHIRSNVSLCVPARRDLDCPRTTAVIRFRPL